MIKEFELKIFGCICISIFFLLSCSHIDKQTLGSNNLENVRLTADSSVVKSEKNEEIQLLDTVINKSNVSIKWFSNGKIKVKLNGYSDSIKWFPFDEFSDKIDHSAIILKGNKQPERIVMNDSLIVFSIIDFKGRAVLFLINRMSNGSIKFSKNQNNCINPIINESAFLYIDLKNEFVINHGGREQGPDSMGNSFYIFSYRMKDHCFILSKKYKSKNKKNDKLDLSNFKDAAIFYKNIQAE